MIGVSALMADWQLVQVVSHIIPVVSPTPTVRGLGLTGRKSLALLDWEHYGDDDGSGSRHKAFTRTIQIMATQCIGFKGANTNAFWPLCVIETKRHQRRC